MKQSAERAGKMKRLRRVTRLDILHYLLPEARMAGLRKLVVRRKLKDEEEDLLNLYIMIRFMSRKKVSACE